MKDRSFKVLSAQKADGGGINSKNGRYITTNKTLIDAHGEDGLKRCIPISFTFCEVKDTKRCKRSYSNIETY